MWTFAGTVLIDRAGEYTFCTKSDDGSNMWVDGLRVVSNDGSHAPVERCGSMVLAQGHHIAYVDGFDGSDGGAGVYLEVTYKGPDTFGKVDHVRSVDCKAHPGWNLEVYRGHDLREIPNTLGMHQVGNAVVQTIDLKSQYFFNLAAPACPQQDFAWKLDGRVYVSEGGQYTFCLRSDDGSYISIDGSQVVNYGGLHGSEEEKCGNVRLPAGLHYVVIEGFDHEGGASMQATYRGPDTKGATEYIRSVGHTDDILQVY